VADGDRRCVACLDAVPPDGTVLVGRLAWDIADSDWFNLRPRRRLRLRRPFDGELFLLGWSDADERVAATERAGLTTVLVVRLTEDDEFVRKPASFPPSRDIDSFTDAAIERMAGGRAALVGETVH
jgi:hypothetical protein